MTEETFFALRPTQPFFIFDTENYRQEIYLKNGISHFYTFTTSTEKEHRIVPDGCIDIIFEYNPLRPGHMHSYVAGTPLEYHIDSRLFHNEIFGVRFMPGNHPKMLNITMKELIEHRYNTEDILNGDKSWLALMAGATEFEQRIKIFTEYHSKFENTQPKAYGRQELLSAVKQMIYNANGNIKIQELQEKTGYTERYINKVFIDEMGFSPKIFCKIIQFQKTLEILNNDCNENMSETAMNLGYYDQSQFIRDFKKYCGTTPFKYKKMQEELNSRTPIVPADL
ncbi:MAG: AraC family transcriptional regulator [Treponema sp.]|nr:AraC family transcriptional regulator [Treponema sp.]